jgi:TonB family protein
MRFWLVLPCLFAACIASAQTSSVLLAPLGTDELQSLIKVQKNASSRRVAELVLECGIRFAPTAEYLAALKKRGAKKVVLDAVSSARQIKEPRAEGLEPPAWAGAGAKDVKPPTPIYKPEPPYPEIARRDKVLGIVVLWVAIDAQGRVSDVRLLSDPLGHGLEESAVNTVRTWKFKPATRKGVPVSSRLMVETSFRLF